MKIAFFLLPKSEIVCFDKTITMRQALERMNHHHLTAVPMIDHEGKYAGTISASDLISKFKENPSYTIKDTSKIALDDIKLNWNLEAVNIDADVQSLLSKALEQNFIPVVDDYNTFIGIVRRREIMEFFMKNLVDKEKLANTELKLTKYAEKKQAEEEQAAEEQSQFNKDDNKIDDQIAVND